MKALTGITDGVTVLETVAKPGEPAPLDHVHHSYDEVFYVVEGELEFRVGERRKRAQVLHGALVDACVAIPGVPFDGPFGRTFTFTDPDGYAVTVHVQA